MTEKPKNRIAEIRKARGMTQQELADAVGAHWITISKLERGRIRLTTDWLGKLARPLGVHARDLLPGTSSPLGFGVQLAEPDGTFPAISKLLSNMEKRTKEQGPFRLKIEGQTYEPFLHAGDTVSLIPLRSIDQKGRKHLEGRLCFSDIGTKAIRPGFLYSGKKSSTYDLFWLGRRVVVGANATRIYLVTEISFGLGTL
jgi:transcriptional regulator with XRE-family HTH domain